jgi:hypothetical protein
VARTLSGGIRSFLAAALAGLFLPAASAAAPGQVPLNDVLQILQVGRDLVAVNADSSVGLEIPLNLGERVVEQRTRGIVGVALTDRRILAVSTQSGSWQAEPYRISEFVTGSPLLGDRLALIQTNVRVIGFDGGTGNLLERRLGPQERVLRWDVSSNVAVLVTDRRAMGLSPFAGGFFVIDVGVDEPVERVAATGNVATVTTSRRVLTFRASDGLWTSRSTPLAR